MLWCADHTENPWTLETGPERSIGGARGLEKKEEKRKKKSRKGRGERQRDRKNEEERKNRQATFKTYVHWS